MAYEEDNTISSTDQTLQNKENQVITTENDELEGLTEEEKRFKAETEALLKDEKTRKKEHEWWESKTQEQKEEFALEIDKIIKKYHGKREKNEVGNENEFVTTA